MTAISGVDAGTLTGIWGADGTSDTESINIESDIATYLAADDDNEFTFTYAGEEYSIRQTTAATNDSPAEYAIYDSNGKEVIGATVIINTEVTDGYIEVQGLGEPTSSESVFIGNEPGFDGQIFISTGAPATDASTTSGTGPANISVHSTGSTVSGGDSTDGTTETTQTPGEQLGFVSDNGELTETGRLAESFGLIDEQGNLTPAGKAVFPPAANGTFSPVDDAEAVYTAINNAAEAGFIDLPDDATAVDSQTTAAPVTVTDLGIIAGLTGATSAEEAVTAGVEAGLLKPGTTVDDFSSESLTPYGEIVVADIRTDEQSDANLLALGFTDELGGALNTLGEAAQDAGLIDANGNLTDAGKAFQASLPANTEITGGTSGNFDDLLDEAVNNGFIKLSSDGETYIATDFGYVAGAAGSAATAIENGWLDPITSALSPDAQIFADEKSNEANAFALGFTNADGSLTDLGRAASELVPPLIDADGNLTLEGKIFSVVAEQLEIVPTTAEDLTTVIESDLYGSLVDSDGNATDLGIVVGAAGGFEEAENRDWIEVTSTGTTVTATGTSFAEQVRTGTTDTPPEAGEGTSSSPLVDRVVQAAGGDVEAAETAGLIHDSDGDGQYELTPAGDAFLWVVRTNKDPDATFEDLLNRAVSTGLLNPPESTGAPYTPTPLGEIIGAKGSFAVAANEGLIDYTNPGWSVTNKGEQYIPPSDLEGLGLLDSEAPNGLSTAGERAFALNLIQQNETTGEWSLTEKGQVVISNWLENSGLTSFESPNDDALLSVGLVDDAHQLAFNSGFLVSDASDSELTKVGIAVLNAGGVANADRSTIVFDPNTKKYVLVLDFLGFSETDSDTGEIVGDGLSTKGEQALAGKLIQGNATDGYSLTQVGQLYLASEPPDSASIWNQLDVLVDDYWLDSELTPTSLGIVIAEAGSVAQAQSLGLLAKNGVTLTEAGQAVAEAGSIELALANGAIIFDETTNQYTLPPSTTTP